ncbi:hypothetical protein AKJ37_06150 [candidate division MSBL1 archaeon SCGC-AAA259I09]|uniref:Uncharacterized protein n=1 Tax=candidate division MSBL1 archaeon SCGC-AAA259I09 TaxID=1698267 RepID=A0A133UPA4_9EURY|nr:hypothetical protein AKJ37_06150 [candidate division MSBL1 archaeon SCGC-AAA259I09]
MFIGLVIGLIGYNYVIDDGAINLITGVNTDFLVVAAFSAISLPVIYKVLPTLLTVTIGVGLVTMAVLYFLIRRTFSNHRFDRIIPLHGWLTGQVPSAMALLRILDPRYRSVVFRDYVAGLFLAAVFILPVIIFGGLHMIAWATGNMMPFWSYLGLLLGYIGIIGGFWKVKEGL